MFWTAAKDKKKGKAGSKKKPGPPKPMPISMNPAASLAVLHRARRKGGR